MTRDEGLVCERSVCVSMYGCFFWCENDHEISKLQNVSFFRCMKRARELLAEAIKYIENHMKNDGEKGDGGDVENYRENEIGKIDWNE